MKVTVKFTPYLRVQTKTSQTVVDVDEDARVSDLLELLTARYGRGLKDLVYSAEQGSGNVWPVLVVDGQAIPLPPVPESDVKLKEGSVVVLMSPFGGG